MVIASLLFPVAFEAQAFSTGIPLKFSIDPATVRQRDKDETPLQATVFLKAPSPTFFVCQIRSSHNSGVTFANIVFKKGQTQGTSTGTVHWPGILKDSTVKVSAFSVDSPGEKLWFTISLKTKSGADTVDGREAGSHP